MLEHGVKPEVAGTETGVNSSIGFYLQKGRVAEVVEI
jgi:hypothetical protein